MWTSLLVFSFLHLLVFVSLVLVSFLPALSVSSSSFEDELSSCNCTINEVCDFGRCQPSSCFDLEWSPESNETDVDCGGELCFRRCSQSRRCAYDEDCSSGVCSARRHICLPNECGDGQLSGNETAVDCGGPQCDPCDAGKDCERNEDCISRKCETNDRFICLESDCEGKECGSSPFCPRCPVGASCQHDAQCESGHCEAGVCYHADCERCGVRPLCPPCSAGEPCEDDSQCSSKRCSEITRTCLAEYCEDGVGRCGGLCEPCGHGGSCDSDDDCSTGLNCDLDALQCSPKHCFDGVLQPELESDIDCGGECISKCLYLESCRGDSDCSLNGICDPDAKKCIAATCVNHRRDANETDVDCGNSAISGCLPCQRSGSMCVAPSDADSSIGMVCDVNLQAVVPSHCLDNKLSGDETSVDCGGSSCGRRCPPGANCVVDGDCMSNDCYEGLCVPLTCHNKKLDFNETDVDCGGGFCRPCSLSAKCRLDSDCASGMCSEFTSKCQPPECATHCGGPCDPCPDSTPCSSNSDCLSGYCYGESNDVASLIRSFELFQDVKSGNFLFLDAARGVCLPSRCQSECGKGDCPGCAAGEKCSSDSECASGSCDPVKLRCHASTCFNNVKDEEETDIDCGGPLCPPCTLASQSCVQPSDCASKECSKSRNKCIPLSCFNLVKDNRETDVDCGGSECNPCEFMGAGCRIDEDCTANFTCSPNDKVCVPTTCFNGLKDPGEVDVDCGLEACGVPCKDGSVCTVAADCASGICHKQHCLPVHCAAECGQIGCPNRCEPGDMCERDHQCDPSSVCLHSRCVNEQACHLDWKALNASDPSGCGGPKCSKCSPHRLCQQTSDCDFGLVCGRNSRRCEFETCFDGMLSPGEVCVDGGGICRRRCGIGQTCKSTFDCERNAVCTSDGVCSDKQEQEDLRLKEERERLLAESKPFELPPFPEMDESIHEESGSPAVTEWANKLIHESRTSVQRNFREELDAVTDLSHLPSLSLQSKSDIDWQTTLNAVVQRIRSRIEGENERIHIVSTNTMQEMFQGKLLSPENLCQSGDDSSCVLESLTRSDQMIYPHVFYVVGKDADIHVAEAKLVAGLFVSYGSRLAFNKGVEVQALSVVASGSVLTLGAGDSRFIEGLVVEPGAKLVLLAGASVTGKRLLVLGEVELYGDAVLDMEDTMRFLGKMSVMEPGVHLKTSAVVTGMLELRGGSSFRSDTAVVITGTVFVERGQHAILDAVHSMEFTEGAFLIVPASSRISVVAKSRLLFASTSARSSKALAWITGILELSEHSEMMMQNGSHLVCSDALELHTASRLSITGASSFVLIRKLQLGDNTVVWLQSPVLVLSSLNPRSPSSVLKLESDLVLVEPSSTIKRVLQGRTDFLPQGRVLIAQDLTAAAVTLNTTTTATTNRVEFQGPVVVSSISEFIVGLPDRPFLELVFLAQVIFTHPTVFYSNTTLEFHSQALLANSVQNQGHFVLTSQAYMVISHTYTGAGTVSNAGAIVVLGDVLCSSKSFTGQGTIFVGSAPSSVMDVFSQRIFAFLEPTGVFPCAAGSVAQRLSLSLVSTTHLLIHFCVPSAQRTREGLLDVIRPSLDIGEPDPILTRPNGVPLTVGESLPDTVRLHPTNSQLKSILSSAVAFQRKLVSSTTEGGTLEFSQSARVSVQGQVTISSTGYMALSRKAQSSFTGGFEAQGDVWIGPDTATTFSWVVESTSNFTIEKTANVTFTRASAIFSGHLSQSGSVSCLLYTNFTADGFFENHGDFFAAATTSVSFLAPHGTKGQGHVYGLSPIFYFTEGSIMDSRGYLYFGPRTRSMFEKGALIESSGVFILEETGWILVETSYLFLDGTTEILGQLILKGRQAKAKFLGTSARVAGLVSAESESLVELLSKSTYVQAPGMVQTKSQGKVIHGTPQGVFTSVGGSVNGSVDFIGLDSKITWRQNSSFSCYDRCQVKRVNMTLESECRMDVFGSMEMNANFRSEVGSTVTIHGPNGTLHVLGGEFEILGNFTSTNGGEVILESPRISGRRDLIMDRTVVKTQMFSTSSCSGESLVIHPGASLKLTSSFPSRDNDDFLKVGDAASPVITCVGQSPLVVEPGATLIIAAHVRMVRKLLTWKDSKVIIEENAKLELVNDVINVLSGEIVLEKHAQLSLHASEVEFEGKTTLAMNSLVLIEQGEVKIQDGSELLCIKPGCSVVIHHRAFLSVAASGSVLAVTGENSFLDIQGKLKNNGRLMIAGHGTKAMFSGHYIGLGDVTIDNFAKVFIKGSFVSSFPSKFENSGGFVVFVRGSESLIRARSFLITGMAKAVVEESSKVSIHSERLEFSQKTKFMVSGGNVSIAQSYLQGSTSAQDDSKIMEAIPLLTSLQNVMEVGGVWITSHSSVLDVTGSIRVRRGARMELEGKLRFATKSFSDFIRLEQGSTLKVISGSLHMHPDVFLESGAEFFVLGSVKVFSSRFVNNGGLVSVEGKLSLKSSEVSFKFGTLDVLPSGAVHMESPKCEAMGSFSEEGEGGLGFHFSHESAIHSQGLLQVHPCAKVFCNAKLTSSGDVVLDVNSRLILYSSATFDSSLPSTVHIEGELVIEKGSNLKWSASSTGTATALIQVMGSLQFASREQPVDVSFVLETSDVNLLRPASTNGAPARAGLVVKESGILSGSVQLRNCSLIVQGRLEPGDLERVGLISVNGGDFELLPGGFLETDVRTSKLQQPRGGGGDDGEEMDIQVTEELIHDTVDVKHGNVRIYSQSTIAFAVLDVDKFDLSILTCDVHRLSWTRESLRIAAYSVDFEKAFEELSYHVYETESTQGASLRVRVEALNQPQQATTGDHLKPAAASKTASRSTVTMMKERADPMLTLASTGVHRIRLADPSPHKQGVTKIVEKYLGGVVEMETDHVLAVHCFEPFECRAFCQVLDLVRDVLAKELQVEFVSEHPVGACDLSRFWPPVLLPCVTDGMTGTAVRGELCDFPFEFQGVTYSSNCANDEILGDWCLTAQGHWGGCVCGPYLIQDEESLKKKQSKTCVTNGLGKAEPNEPCVFPFFEDRSSHEPHYGCVGSGMGGFGFCRIASGELGGCSSTCSTSSHASSSNHSASPPICVTNGRGSAPGGKRCVFPFEWMGMRRFECVGSGWGMGEGFCMTASGQRGGCACSNSSSVYNRESIVESLADAVYFVHGPSVHVVSEDSIQVTAEVSSTASRDGNMQWYVFVVPHDSRPPGLPSSSLGDAVAIGSRDTSSVIVKNLDWRNKYDMYVYVPGFDQEDFVANAVTGIKLKPPTLEATRFHVEVKGSEGLLNVELIEGGEKKELLITRQEGDDDDDPRELVDILLEPSVPDQLWLSEQSFLLRKEKTIQIQAVEDEVREEANGPSVILHVIDVERSARIDVEIAIRDALRSSSSAEAIEDGGGKDEQQPQSLVLITSSADDEEEDSSQIITRRKLMTIRGKGQTREYFVRLASPPSHPVVIHIEPVETPSKSTNDIAVAEPSTLVFTKNDWDKQKRVRVSSTSNTGGALFRHRIRSRDSRFADALMMEMQVRILEQHQNGKQNKNKQNEPPLHEDERYDLGPAASSNEKDISSVISILPADSYLFPKTSIQFQLHTSSSLSFRLSPKLTLVAAAGEAGQDHDSRKLQQQLPQQLYYNPSMIELNRTNPSAKLTVWMERDPGVSFASRLSFEVKNTGLNKDALEQLREILAPVQATIRYISRSPAIVLSKSSLSGVDNDEYSISLSVPHEKVVTVRVSTATDSVCLDLDANMRRPCNPKLCRRCLEDVPEVQISPMIVKFTPSTTSVKIKVTGWADNQLLEPRRQPNEPIWIRHQVLLMGTDDPLFPETTPTVFGPGDSRVEGIVIPKPGARPSPDSGDDEEDDDPTKRAARVKIVPGAIPGEFKLTLAFLCRAPVVVQVEGCYPDTLRFETWKEEWTTRCFTSTSVKDEHSGGFKTKFVVTSEDPHFDQIETTVDLPPGTPASPDERQNKSESDGMIVKIVVGITSSLTTAVALLVVWVFMGPRAAQAWRQRQGGRSGSTGRKSGARGGKRPPPSSFNNTDRATEPPPPQDESASSFQIPANVTMTTATTGTMSSTLSIGTNQQPEQEKSTSVLTRRHISAVVPVEDAQVMFSVPPPERFHVGDVVVVQYEVFEDVQYFKGRIVEENESSETFVVQFIDGDVDQEVDPYTMRSYSLDTLRPRSISPAVFGGQTKSTSHHQRKGSSSSALSSPQTFYDVRLSRTAEQESFGLKIGWTTNDRVVVTGFLPNTPASQCLDIQLGDEIIGMNGRKTPGSFEAVMALMRSSGLDIDLRLRPVARPSSVQLLHHHSPYHPMRVEEEEEEMMEDDGHSGSGTVDLVLGGEEEEDDVSLGAMENALMEDGLMLTESEDGSGSPSSSLGDKDSGDIGGGGAVLRRRGDHKQQMALS